MTVHELIEQLKKLDPGFTVYHNNDGITDEVDGISTGVVTSEGEFITANSVNGYIPDSIILW